MVPSFPHESSTSKKTTEPFILEKCLKSSALKASLPGYLLLHQEFIYFMIPFENVFAHKG